MRVGRLEVSGGALETGWWGPGPSDTPTLVLLHEGLGSVALWRDVPERLAAATGWGVFAYSRFGYGHSDGTPLPRPMNYMQHEAQVVLPEVLRAAEIRNTVLVGHSDGGSIAAVYAGSPCLSSPEGVASTFASRPHLVRPRTRPGESDEVVGGRAKPGHDTGGEGRDTSGESLNTGGDKTPSQPTLLGLVTIAAHFIVEDLNIESIRQIKVDYDSGPLRPRLARYHRDVDTAFRGWNDTWLDPRFRDFDITEFLSNIQVPILALQGAEDPYGSDEQLRIMEANVTAPIVTQLIAGAQHSPHLEAKDATLAAVASFIAGLRCNERV